MALQQIAFFSTTLDANLGTGTSIAIVLASYTVIDSNLSTGDTIELVIDRNSISTREIVLAQKSGNGNYILTQRGLYGTSDQAHDSGVEVTNDNTPGYYEGLRDGSLIDFTGVASGTIDGDLLTDNSVGAAKIKGEAWTSWTPTFGGLTLGNGTLTAGYIQIGKTVFYRVRVVFGTTTSISGAVSFSPPVTIRAGIYTADAQLGWLHCLDAATLSYYGIVYFNLTTQLRLRVYNSSGTYVTPTDLSSSVPFTWGNNDGITVEGFYEAA